MKNLSIVLVSGGMDSCVTAAIAAQNYEMAFLHFTYGQRTANRELLAFNRIADFYNVKNRKIIEFAFFKEIGGSSLTDESIEVPLPNLESKKIPSTYVPFRNAHLLSFAVSWGEVIGAKKIFIGAVFEDSSGYPDCRPEFYNTFNKLIDVGTKPDTDIEVLTPVIYLRKCEIVRKGVELNAPLHLTWSCYKNNDIACGECESCLLRLRGFKDAGVKDPIPYKIRNV